MSDLISRKEVAEILNHQRFGIAQISWDIISEKIKALPPVEQTEWISVKDGLPKENSTYRITLQTDDGYRYVAGDYFYTERNSFESEAYYRGVGRKIIAWQPITEPSPYKGDEK